MKKKLLIGLVGLVVIVLGGVMVFGNVPPDASGGSLKSVKVKQEVAPVKSSLKGKSVIKEAPKSKKAPLNSNNPKSPNYVPTMSEGQNDSNAAEACDCDWYQTSACTNSYTGGDPAQEVAAYGWCADDFRACMNDC